MRADRLLSLLLLLQSHGRLTAQQLADELEVSERTVYRDVTALGIAGVPVYAERGPGGGICLLDSYRTTLTGLSTAEARALFMLNIPAALEQLGVGRELRLALLKLSAALPAARRADEDFTRKRIYLDWSPWQQQIERQTALPYLPLLQNAVWQDQQVWMRYKPLFAPWIPSLELSASAYALAAKAGRWFLVAENSSVFHVIAVDLVAEASLLPEHFQRLDTFDLPVFWQNWCAQRHATRPTFHAMVRAAPEAFPLLSRQFELVELMPAAPDARGWSVVSLTCEIFEQARQALLACGGSVEVLDPLALRLSVADFARQAVALYGKTIPDSTDVHRKIQR